MNWYLKAAYAKTIRGYWISPSGEMYPVSETHGGLEGLKIIQKDLPNAENSYKYHFLGVINFLLANRYIRIVREGGERDIDTNFSPTPEQTQQIFSLFGPINFRPIRIEYNRRIVKVDTFQDFSRIMLDFDKEFNKLRAGIPALV